MTLTNLLTISVLALVAFLLWRVYAGRFRRRASGARPPRPRAHGPGAEGPLSPPGVGTRYRFRSVDFETAGELMPRIRHQRRERRPLRRQAQLIRMRDALQKQARQVLREPVPPAAVRQVPTTPPTRTLPHLEGAPAALPAAYGVDEIVALAKDPYWVYVYWELTGPAEGRVLAALGREAAATRRALRVYDLDGGGQPGSAEGRWWQITLELHDDHWFIQAGVPGHRYVVEVGRLGADERFHLLARSNEVVTPHDQPEDGGRPSLAELYLKERGLASSPHGSPARAWSGDRLPQSTGPIKEGERS